MRTGIPTCILLFTINSFSTSHASPTDACPETSKDTSAEIFWGLQMAESPDSFICKLNLSDIKTSQDTYIEILYEESTLVNIHEWNTQAFNYQDIKSQGVSYSELVNQIPKAIHPSEINGPTFDKFSDFLTFYDATPESIPLNDWLSHLLQRYKREQTDFAYRSIINLKDISPQNPSGYYLEGPCPHIIIGSLPLAGTTWSISAQFKSIDNGHSLLVERIKSGAMQHSFGELNTIPLHTSCALSELSFSPSELSDLAILKLTRLTDAFNQKLKNLYPSLIPKSLNNGARFSTNGTFVNYGVDSRDRENFYPTGIHFFLTQQKLYELNNRGLKELITNQDTSEISL